ncbi:MAG: recombinase family protein [Desulfuromonadales bacterium]|jgi:DNA invertase Pin-like site-specific DNA recombinase|nr:recombinase family protein [Desulfuromonadales bacterium]MDH3807033.1 recombinase family protein [Desulfuromonadales bacterium]MDH3867748.1 recombinase family protein [Desulfuromonadales bacterium]MDH3959647.1 recombinase family protein [Desulfuromonadales bacterium]MDH4024408.1 recombinase family protein [Desulfuromonadales bacterium]
MTNGKFISYLRVSTARQGISGLGLEAQRTNIENYLNGSEWTLLKEFVEVESGKKSDRPQLLEALKLCKATGAVLLIAKLDRLSRDAYFLLGLQKADVKFVAVDMPTANELTVGIMALVAQEERKSISTRTKNALAVLRERGIRLGNPRNLTPEAAKCGRVAGVAAIKNRADSFARDSIDRINQLKADGQSLNAIAKTLNQEGILTATGKSRAWTARSVKNVIDRVNSS